MDVQPDFRDLLALFNGHEVDYLTGITWEEARSGRVSGTYGGVPVHYIGRQQFIANRKATGRKKDLADLEALGED